MGNNGVNLDKVSIEITANTSKAGQNINQLVDTLTALRNATKRSSTSLSKLSSSFTNLKSVTSGFKKFGSTAKSVTSVSSNGFKILQKQNDAFFKSLSKNSSKAISKIKQIGLSLLGTRTIFTATRKAVSEYMAMDADLTWKVTNNWRALGAQLSLAIENVTWVFKQFIRVIYSVILALTGIDLIARANQKAMEGWGKAAKDTLGNLQKFDDLNVVEFPKATGSGDDNKLIELDTIDLTPIQKIIDWVRKLRDEIKEAWNSGQWYGVGEVLAEGLNGALNAINFDKIEEKFKDIAKKFGDFLRGVVENFNWALLGSQLSRQLSLIPRITTQFLKEIPWEEIGEGLNKALETFDVGLFIDSLFGQFIALVEGLQTIFLKIDGKLIGKKISDGILSILSNIDTLINKIEWKKIGTKIREAIENIDWNAIWENVVNILKDALGGIGDFFNGLFGNDNAGGVIATVFGGAAAITGGMKLSGIVSEVSKKVSSLGTAFKLLGQNTLTTGTISQITGVAQPLLDVFGALGSSLPIIGAVVAGLVVVGAAIADLYKNNEDFKKTVDDLFSSIKSTFMPILETFMNTVKQLWKSVIVPLFNLLVEVVKPFIVAAIDIISVLWENALKPVVDILSDLFAQILPPLISVIGEVIDVVTWLWKNILGPVIDFLLKVVVANIKLATGDIDGAIETISDAFLGVIEAGKNLWKKISDYFNKIGTKIGNSIDNIKKKWSNFWDNINTLPKRMLQGLVNLLNNVIGKLNDKLSINIGDKTAKLLKTLGVTISEGRYQLFSIPKIPALDTGTNEIPYEGMYHLHPGEAVVPKKYNPALGGGTNEETNRRLDTLISILEEQDHVTNVYVGNKKLYKEQKKYSDKQVNKYGTIRVQ